MKIATPAGVLATAGLLAYGPVHTAHATTPVTPKVQCHYDEVDDSQIELTVSPPDLFSDLVVRLDGELIEYSPTNDPAVVIVEAAEVSDSIFVEVSFEDGRERIKCTEHHDEPTATPTETQPTPSPAPSETPTEPELTPPTTTPGSPESSSPTEPPSSATAPPSSSPPTTPASPSTPPTTTQSQAPSAPWTPNTAVPEATPEPAPQTERAPSEHRSETDQPIPRQFRPLAESPRYLLPHLLGTQSAQRGSPLILPQPQNTQDRADALETLPPISEDELDAIKAQLSSPGRADTAISSPHAAGAQPDERISQNSSWWFVAGLTALLGVAGGGWLYWHRRKRRH